MTDGRVDGRPETAGSRATVRTEHDDPGTVAAALRPDNTAEMATRIEDDRVVTAIERETAAGLRSTLDDYLVNVAIAARLADDRNHTP